MHFLKFALCLFSINIALTNALSLDPIIEYPASYFDISLHTNNTNPNTIAEMLRTADLIDLYIQVNVVASVISHVVSNDNTTPRNLQWPINVKKRVGMMKFAIINAHIDNYQIRIYGWSVLLDQPIPILYETKQKCVRIDKRSYAFIGSKGKKCNEYYVGRNLKKDEIFEIDNRLIMKAQEVTKKMN